MFRSIAARRRRNSRSTSERQPPSPPQVHGDDSARSPNGGGRNNRVRNRNHAVVVSTNYPLQDDDTLPANTVSPLVQPPQDNDNDNNNDDNNDNDRSDHRSLLSRNNRTVNPQDATLPLVERSEEEDAESMRAIVATPLPVSRDASLSPSSHRSSWSQEDQETHSKREDQSNNTSPQQQHHDESAEEDASFRGSRVLVTTPSVVAAAAPNVSSQRVLTDDDPENGHYDSPLPPPPHSVSSSSSSSSQPTSPYTPSSTSMPSPEPENTRTSSGVRLAQTSDKKKRKSRDNKPNAATATTITTAATATTITTAATTATTTSLTTRKRGRRQPRTVVLEASPPPAGLPLPLHQFECVLRRRAIRKLDEGETAADAPSSTSSSSIGFSEDGDYGDVSLGMKLTIASGKVIVQNLNALQDGRASPAQLTGMIRRGDVLLAINYVSLTNLSIDQLMRGLEPLSKPNAQGVYQRDLLLRFEALGGLDLIRDCDEPHSIAANNAKQEAAAATTTTTTMNTLVDAANEVFTLFPMVDSLSGRPLFENLGAPPLHHEGPESSVTNGPSVRTATSQSLEDADPRHQEAGTLSSAAVDDVGTMSDKHHQVIIPLDETISRDIAHFMGQERGRFLSKFFARNSDNIPGMLKVPDSMRREFSSADAISPDKEDGSTAVEHEDDLLTLTETMERGRRATMGALALSARVEVLDKGGESRPYKSWNATLSLYSRSRAGTRSRKWMEGAVTLPVAIERVEEKDEEDEEESKPLDQSSTSSNEGNDLDDDEVLVRLAANDEIWRKQVIESLNQVAQKAQAVQDGEDTHLDETTDPLEEHKDINELMASDFGSFLFGEQVNNMLQKRQQPLALPPDEITSVLYDLTTKTSSIIIPDELTAPKSCLSYRSASATSPLLPKRIVQGTDGHLATQFLLNEALPVWLKTFRPLPWEERRMIWPLEKQVNWGSTAGSNHSDDSLTQDSMATNQVSLASKQHVRKNLREIIEEQELDPRTRAEARFLSTFYFTQKLLPHFKPEASNEEIFSFVKMYGSYLSLPTCLARAARLKAKAVIQLLLDVAKHDPVHNEAMKHATKTTSLVFFEPTMLSAVIQMLWNIQNVSLEMKQATIDLCASAYPDIRPWQVREQCVGDFISIPSARQCALDDAYYLYLSHLLNPQDGHDAARKDLSLVKEWCELSVRQKDHGSNNGKSKDRMSNFYAVASRTSSQYLAYKRDLVHLMRLSMEANEIDLALDLAGEILDDKKLSMDQSALNIVFETLRRISLGAIGSQKDTVISSASSLRRVLRIYQKAEDSSSPLLQGMLDVPSELLKWIEYHHATSGGMRKGGLELIQFLADEAVPADVLTTIQLRLTSCNFSVETLEILPVLRATLSRAATSSAGGELTGALLRMKHARDRLDGHVDNSIGMSLWEQMANGLLNVSK